VNNQIFKQAQTLIAENSAALLTGTGVIGVVTTAILTGKASIKAHLLVEDMARQDISAGPVTTKEKVVAVAPLYVPAVASGLTTIGAIIFSYRISVSKSAALAAAYGISEKAFGEYKEKVLEHVTPKKAGDITDAVAKQQMTDNPPPSSQVMVVADGDILCLDTFSGRYFRCSIERIRKAENEINLEIANHNVASLGDFYEKIGLPQTDMSETFGWTLNNIIEIDYSTQMTDDGRPCVVVTFTNAPQPGFQDRHN